MAEDWAFCHRVLSAGGRIVTERSLLVGHYEVEDGLVYFVHRPPTIPNGAHCPLPVPKGHTLRTSHLQRDYGVVVSRYFLEPPQAGTRRGIAEVPAQDGS